MGSRARPGKKSAPSATAPVALRRAEVKDSKRTELADLVLIRTEAELAGGEPRGFYIVPKMPATAAAGATSADPIYYVLYELNGLPPDNQLSRIEQYLLPVLDQIIDAWDKRGLAGAFGIALGFMLKAVRLRKSAKKSAKGSDTAAEGFLGSADFAEMESKDAARAKLIRDLLSSKSSTP